MSHDHASSLKTLLIAVSIIGIFSIVEALGGFAANSLTLLGDAGHMAADTISLVVASIAAWLAHRPPSKIHTYGFERIEVISAFVSGILLLLIVIGIVIEAIENLRLGESVHGQTMIIIGIIGVAANIGAGFVLHRGEQNLNIRAAFIHVLSDLLGAFAAVIAGTIIVFTHWTPIDPILSLFVCLLILRTTYHLLKEAFHVLMEGSPQHINVNDIAHVMMQNDNIKSVHDIHLWVLTSHKLLFSAHVVISDISLWEKTLDNIKEQLKEKFHIEHITLQPEIKPLHDEAPMSCTVNCNAHSH